MENGNQNGKSEMTTAACTVSREQYVRTLKEMQSLIGEDMLRTALDRAMDFSTLMAYYRCAIMEIETKFNVLNQEFSLRFDRQPICGIKTRLKSVVSIRNKLAARGLPFTVAGIEENLSDVAGIRVICSFVDDVYKIADTLLRQDDITLIERKDYIAEPKENGYRSLHLIVAVPIFLENEKRVMRAEIQLRTAAMDSWASLEHQLNYKKKSEYDEAVAADLKRCAQLSAEFDARMNQLKNRMLTDTAVHTVWDEIYQSEPDFPESIEWDGQEDK